MHLLNRLQFGAMRFKKFLRSSFVLTSESASFSMITMRFKVVCTNSVEENWLRDHLDYWWGLDGETESISA